jgi:RimJ/RimL family protein N-acetyltransferase
LITGGAVLELLPHAQGTIRLRRLDSRDAEDYAEGAEDDLVKRFGHLPLDRYTPEVVRQQLDEVIDPGLRAGTLAVLAIADVESDDFLGSAVVFDIEGDQAEVGYWVAPWARGRAVATNALSALVGLAASIGIRRLVAKTAPENIASHRVLARSGFSRVGEPTEEQTPSGRLATMLTYSRSQRERSSLL